MRKMREERDTVLQIREVEEKEFFRVRDFYDSLIEAMAETEFFPGWEKDIYPTQAFLMKSIRSGELYVAEKGEDIAGCMVVNHEYNEGYKGVQWEVDAEDEELLVIHILGVHPKYAGRGIAKQMVQKVIDMAREKKIKAIRLDVLAGNLPAERVYTKMGFVYRDTFRMFYEDTGWTDFRLFEYSI